MRGGALLFLSPGRRRKWDRVCGIIKITNKEDAKRTIYYNSDDGNLSLNGDAWVDSTFSIDSEGNVFCESFKHSSSRFSRFMDMIAG